MKTVFCDSDGVLADFNSGFFKLFGRLPDDVPDNEMWQLIGTIPHFYLTLPKFTYTGWLWRKLRHLKPVILTGAPRDNYDEAVQDKKTWYAANLPGLIEVIVCKTKDKPQHMRATGDVLIDDSKDNIAAWEKAGGVGIHFSSPQAAVMQAYRLAQPGYPL